MGTPLDKNVEIVCRSKAARVVVVPCAGRPCLEVTGLTAPTSTDITKLTFHVKHNGAVLENCTFSISLAPRAGTAAAWALRVTAATPPSRAGQAIAAPALVHVRVWCVDEHGNTCREELSEAQLPVIWLAGSDATFIAATPAHEPEKAKCIDLAEHATLLKCAPCFLLHKRAT